MKNLTNEQIKNFLILNFKGQEVESYHSNMVGKLFKYVRDFTGNQNIDVRRADKNPNQLEIVYTKDYWGPKYTIALIDIKRCKAKEYRSHYWHSQFDYKDFIVNVFYKDLEEAIKGFDADLEAKYNKIADDKKKAKEIKEYVMKQYGLTDWQARELCRKASSTYDYN